jgi:hypothetical protein
VRVVKPFPLDIIIIDVLNIFLINKSDWLLIKKDFVEVDTSFMLLKNEVFL